MIGTGKMYSCSEILFDNKTTSVIVGLQTLLIKITFCFMIHFLQVRTVSGIFVDCSFFTLRSVSVRQIEVNVNGQIFLLWKVKIQNKLKEREI